MPKTGPNVVSAGQIPCSHRKIMITMRILIVQNLCNTEALCTPLAEQNHRFLGSPATFLHGSLVFRAAPKKHSVPDRAVAARCTVCRPHGMVRKWTCCLLTQNLMDKAKKVLGQKTTQRPIGSKPTDHNPWILMPISQKGAGPRRSRPLYG